MAPAYCLDVPTHDDEAAARLRKVTEELEAARKASQKATKDIERAKAEAERAERTVLRDSKPPAKPPKRPRRTKHR